MRLLVGFFTLLQEELAGHVEIRIGLDLLPCTKAVLPDADKQHGIVGRIPSTSPVECRLEMLRRDTPLKWILDIVQRLGKKAQVVVSDEHRLGIDSGDATARYEYCLLTEGGGDLFTTLLLALHEGLVFSDGIFAPLDQLVRDLIEHLPVLVLQLAFLDDGIRLVADVAPSLDTTDEDTQVTFLHLHRALSGCLSRTLTGSVLGTAAWRIGLVISLAVIIGTWSHLRGSTSSRRAGSSSFLDGLVALLLLDLLTLFQRDNVVPADVGLEVLHLGEGLEKVLTTGRAACWVYLGLVGLCMREDIVEVHLVKLLLLTVFVVALEHVLSAKLEDSSELLFAELLLVLGRGFGRKVGS